MPLLKVSKYLLSTRLPGPETSLGIDFGAIILHMDRMNSEQYVNNNIHENLIQFLD
jgi:hypothetical protein